MASSYLCVTLFFPIVPHHERGFPSYFSPNQSGLFSVTIIVFIVGGNNKMLCNPIVENTLLIAQMSNDLISMLNGTHDGTPPASPSLVPFNSSVTVWVNVIWSTSLTFSLASTFFGIFLRRWAIRYLLHNLHPIDPRIIRHRRLKSSEKSDTLPPIAFVSLMHLFLPLSVFLFFFGLMMFLVQIGVSRSLVVASSLIIAGILYVSLIIPKCNISSDESFLESPDFNMFYRGSAALLAPDSLRVTCLTAPTAIGSATAATPLLPILGCK